MSDLTILLTILTVFAVTSLLRGLPFIGFKVLASSNYLKFLGKTMPPGIMLLLIAYTLKDLTITEFPYGIPNFVAMVSTALLYWKTNHSLLAIGSGLSIHLIISNFIL